MIWERLFFDTTQQPVWWWAAIIPVALLGAELCRRPAGSISLSTTAIFGQLNVGHLSWSRHMPAVFRFVGLQCLVVAMAGPLDDFRVRTDRADVVDIMLCVDVSSSMAEQDFRIDGEKANRLAVTKIAVANFIANRRIVPEERYGVDRLGLIFYAGIAWTGCPLTLDYVVVEHEMARAEPATDRERRKNGTAIGSAIGLAVRRLSKSEATSKVIILLTDGMNNRNELDPLTAAQLAAEYDIKIYTLGVGPLPQAQRSGGIVAPARMVGDPVDEASLKKIAALSGGAYYRATDSASLEEAYSAISKLEATKVDANEIYEYEEAHSSWVILGAVFLGLSIYGRRLYFEVLP